MPPGLTGPWSQEFADHLLEHGIVIGMNTLLIPQVCERGDKMQGCRVILDRQPQTLTPIPEQL